MDALTLPWQSLRKACRHIPRRHGAAYIGWVGRSNLGDEAMFEATSRLFAPIPLYLARRGRGLLSTLLRECPQLAMLGGGTLVGGPPYGHKLASLLERGVPAIVFGTGVRLVDFWRAIGDQKTELESWREPLKACRYVGVRGPDSVASLAAIGIEAELLGDPAVQFVQSADFHHPRPRTLGVNIGCARGLLWGREEQMLDGLVEFLRRRLGEGWLPEYFVVWPSDNRPTLEVIRRVGQRRPRIHRVYHDAGDYLQRVRRVQVFIGVKLHSVMLAMCAGVPSLMVAYRPKCLDFMKSVDMQGFSVRSDQITPETLGTAWELLQERGQEVARHVLSRLRAYRDLQCQRAACLGEGRHSPASGSGEW